MKEPVILRSCQRMDGECDRLEAKVAEQAATIARLTGALEKAEIGLMLCNPLSGYDMATLHIVRAALTPQEPRP